MKTPLFVVVLLAAGVLMPVGAQTQSKESVIRLDPAFDAIVAPGTMVETLKEGFGFINGILWVREGNTGHLLVSDIPANVVHKWRPDGSMTIMRYDVRRDGTVANGRLFADMNTFKGAGNPDGMKFDEKGNLYSVGPGGISVFSPEGRQIGIIVPPDNAPGFTFGDPDGKAIYMAASSKLARIRLNVAGAGR
jgi:gluconolactonase